VSIFAGLQLRQRNTRDGRGGSSPASTAAARHAHRVRRHDLGDRRRLRGKPLNSPNDVIVKSDGSIWFTDPPFGLLGYYEGHLAKQELPITCTASMARAAK